MRIVTLVENTKISEELESIHGLSVYIETRKRKLLFDSGDGSVFFDNAAKLGVDIAGIDALVISHGHHDHGGGLPVFLEHNAAAPVFIRKRAFLPHLSVIGDAVNYAGIDPELIGNKRLVFTDDLHEIDAELLLFSNVESNKFISTSSAALFEETESGREHDTFRHEQNLLLRAEGKTCLFAGCAHSGIVNILEKAESIAGCEMDAVFGGFHLLNPGTMVAESAMFIRALADELACRSTVYYTGHCTGLEAFGILKETLGESIHYIATGSVINL